MPRVVSTKHQLERLASLMEENTDLARGVCPKALAKPRWEKVAQDLNSLGPPTRSSDAWQRVWNDLKYKTKKKSAHNHVENIATGGGPNNTVLLSNLEDTVNRLMNYTQYNNPPGEEFGVENEEENQDENDSGRVIEILEDHDIQTPSRNRILNDRTRTGRKEHRQIALLEQQTNQQADFQNKSLNTFNDIKKSLSNIETYTKRSYYLKKDKLALYKQDIENKRMARKAKLELKKKLLELKQEMYRK